MLWNNNQCQINQEKNLWWVTTVSIAVVFFEQMINGDTTFDRLVNLCIATVKYKLSDFGCFHGGR